VTYENVPLRRYSLGVVAGFAVGADDDQRAELKSDKVAVDPMNDVVTAITVNIHPKRYDPNALAMTPAERYRCFLGATYTPEFGLMGGVGIGLIRGLSVNVGYGVMRINEIRSGDEFGEAPSRPEDPFDNAAAGFGFLGLGYKF
jgi:hypothetical protein